MGAAAIQLLITYKYFLIVPLSFVEGPVLMLTTGFLLRLDYFSFLPLYVLLMLGDLFGDVLWYCIGYYGGMPFVRRFGKYVSLTEESVEKVKHIFHKHHNKILITSKVTMGFGFALVTLFTAGLTRVPFWRYLTLNIIGGFVWTGLLLGIGYYLGNLYLTVGKGLEVVAIAAGIVIALFLTFGFGKYVRSIMSK